MKAYIAPPTTRFVTLEMSEDEATRLAQILTRVWDDSFNDRFGDEYYVMDVVTERAFKAINEAVAVTV